MNVQDFINEIKSNLTGNKLEDLKYVREKVKEIKREELTKELGDQISLIFNEIVRNDEMIELKEKLIKEIKTHESLLTKAENLFREQNYERAKVVLDKIILQVKDYFVEGDTFHLVNIEDAFAFQVYTNMYYQGEKIVTLVPDHIYKYYYLHGVICTKLNLLDEAEKSLTIALRWFPTSFSVMLEIANVKMMKKQFDDVLPLFKLALQYCFIPGEISRAYRGVGFYAFQIENYRLAMAAYLVSTIYDKQTDIRKELSVISQKMGQEKFQPLPPEESKVEFEKVGLAFGANMSIINFAVSLSKEFELRGDLITAHYFLRIAFSLTNNEDMKKHLDELSEVIKSKMPQKN